MLLPEQFHSTYATTQVTCASVDDILHTVNNNMPFQANTLRLFTPQGGWGKVRTVKS